MAKFNNKLTPQQVFDQNEAEESVSKKKLVAKGFMVASCIIVILMGIIFLLSALFTGSGSFTIRTGQLTNSNGTISLSETPGFSNPTVKLSGTPINGMDNITYSWLPFDELDSIPGSHNGENYIAYTFYFQNSGTESADIKVSANILKATLGVDSAVRFMVYRDGEATVYAKAAEGGGHETVPEGIVDFESDATVFTDIIYGTEAGETHKYSVVIWLEGEDPECTDLILKGMMNFEITIEALETEENVN